MSYYEMQSKGEMQRESADYDSNNSSKSPVPARGVPSLKASIRILVVGDSGVGKTTIVRLLTSKMGPKSGAFLSSAAAASKPSEAKKGAEWTVGCKVEVGMH